MSSVHRRLARGDSFCVLPWIENFVTINGSARLCCWSDVVLEDRAEILNKIWNREKVPHCTKCYQQEENNTISSRQKESVIWLKDPDIKEHFNSEPVPDYKPVYSDLRLDNKCNLGCIGCSPTASSFIAKEIGIIQIKEKPTLDIENLMSMKKIYIAGGEPFLIDSYISLIDLIADRNPNIELVINTNLTYLPESSVESLKKIKKVSLEVSIDSYGKVNEYHRYPLKWSKFIRNLNTLKENNIHFTFNTVVDAVSVFGFTDFKELVNYPHQWHLSPLTSPESLQLKNLPIWLKSVALDNLLEFKKIKFYKQDPMFKSQLDFCISSLNEEGNPSLLSMYIEELDQRRTIRHTDFLGVNLIENKQ